MARISGIKSRLFIMFTRTINHFMSAALLTATTLLSACASPESRVTEDFGTSVRQMVSGQVYDVEAAAHPSEETTLGMDATKAAADVNRVYRRTDITKETIKAVTTSPAGGP